MSESRSATGLRPVDVDAAGVRVLTGIDASCRNDANFLALVEGALRSTLALLSARPDVVRALVEPSLDREVALRREHWRQAFAARLRGAARREPELPALPDFLEPYVIDAVRWTVRSRILNGEGALLLEQVSELSHYVLACYLGAADASAVAHGASIVGQSH